MFDAERETNTLDLDAVDDSLDLDKSLDYSEISDAPFNEPLDSIDMLTFPQDPNPVKSKQSLEVGSCTGGPGKTHTSGTAPMHQDIGFVVSAAIEPEEQTLPTGSYFTLALQKFSDHNCYELD